MKFLEKFYPHLLAFAGFILVSLIYFYPVLQGKEIYQSDIAQYVGMAKEQNDFRASEHVEPYWTNSAFGGMPTYQLGAKYPHDYIGMLDDAIRFLPRPADYLFLYFLGFYALMMVLRVHPLKAFFGALAFGLSTYMIIILGVGHNAKAHAIAYMPLVVAGVLLVFRRRYLWGGILTMFAAALEINANHFQMTYYLLLLLAVISVYYIVRYIGKKDFKPLAKAVGVFAVAGLLAVGANATNLLATSEYAKFSTRSNSDLTVDPDGKKKTTSAAMSREYITEYSYGKAESFNLIAPRLFGGSNSENLGTESETYKHLVNTGAVPEQAREFSEALPTYWGQQPIVAAPAYVGAVVFFLCLLGLLLARRRIKYAFLAGAVLSLLLSWGKHLGFLTDFFIDYVPLYDKFRAVSSIQVLLEFCIPVLAVFGLQAYFREDDDARKRKALLIAAGFCLGLIVVLFFVKGAFDFSGPMDQRFLADKNNPFFGDAFVQALIADRKSLYSADLLRSGFLIAVAAGVLWFALKGKLSRTAAVVSIGLVMIGDLFFIDKNYLDSKAFVSSYEVRQPFHASPADEQIMQDTTHYRVFEIDGNLSSARASYFHQSLGGYHAAKPKRIQELFDYQIAKNNIGVLNMLNVKYIIQSDQNGMPVAMQNPDANGNAWFVKDVRRVKNADAEMKALDKLDTKTAAVLNDVEFGAHFKGSNPLVNMDTTGSIKLVSYKPNHLAYLSDAPGERFAVFSENYYDNGWNVYVDGKKGGHVRVDYTLRGMLVPPGRHKIEFRFEPEVVKTGSTIALASSLLMLVLVGGGLYLQRREHGSQTID
jgi:hypothetical protein